MDNEEKILSAISELNTAVSDGFAAVNDRIESINKRLDEQEHKTRRVYRFQQLQAAEVEKLKEIVFGLARDSPVRSMNHGTAILKSDAYPRFEEQGVSSRKAMRALRTAGMIRLDRCGKNTTTIYLSGHCQRVIIVKDEGGESS